jgi:hypothetical protein
MTFMREAFRAGNRPAARPTRTLNPKAKAMALIAIIGALSVGVAWVMPHTTTREKHRPSSPPTTAMTTLSTMIWVKISKPPAPTAFLMPISRTRC